MRNQEPNREADALSDSERRELVHYLLTGKHVRGSDSPSPRDRSAEFLAWAQRSRPRVGLRDAGRDTIYED